MINFRFRRAYDAEIVPSNVPSDARTFRFAAVEGKPTRMPLVVDVRPWDSDPWRGIFEGYTDSPDAVTGVFAYPDEHKLLVVSGGEGYIVRSDNPTEWQSIAYTPITNIADAPENGLVLVSDFLQVAAYDAAGRIWETRRLAYDGIEFGYVRNGRLIGRAWSAPLDRAVPFAVDLATGGHEGGAWRSVDVDRP